MITRADSFIEFLKTQNPINEGGESGNHTVYSVRFSNHTVEPVLIDSLVLLEEVIHLEYKVDSA